MFQLKFGKINVLYSSLSGALKRSSGRLETFMELV